MQLKRIFSCVLIITSWSCFGAQLSVDNGILIGAACYSVKQDSFGVGTVYFRDDAYKKLEGKEYQMSFSGFWNSVKQEKYDKMVDSEAFTRLKKPLYITIEWRYPGGKKVFGRCEEIDDDKRRPLLKRSYSGPADIKSEQYNVELFKPHQIFNTLKKVEEKHDIGHVKYEVVYNDDGEKIIDKVTSTHRMLQVINILWIPLLLCLMSRYYTFSFIVLGPVIATDLKNLYDYGLPFGSTYLLVRSVCCFSL